MKVRVLYFSLLRDVAGCEEKDVEISPGETVGDLLGNLMEESPGLRDWEDKILVAVDQGYAGRDTVLEGGEEVAVMPPVQGG